MRESQRRQWSRRHLFPVSSTVQQYSEQKAKIKRLMLESLKGWAFVHRKPKPVVDNAVIARQGEPAMTTTQALLFAFLIGVFGGLRSLTAPAAMAWAAHRGWLSLQSPLAWLGTLPAVILLTLLALGELIADKLPKTPSRTAPPGLIGRIVLGGLCGAAIYFARSNQGIWPGAVVGATGGVVGCFGGYQVRTRLVKALASPDYVVAVLEDLVAIGGSVWVVSRF